MSGATSAKATIVDDLQSEKEQIEEMRAWWAEYGRYVIGGIVVGAALLFGWNQYKSSKLDAQIEASQLFESLVQEVADGDLDAAESISDELANNYANTSYAAQSKLAMARLYMDKNRDEDAADVLIELLDSRGNDELKHVGRLRLAKIRLYQDRAEDVIALLEGQDAPAFGALYAEALGDAYAAQERYDEAAAAYQRALADATAVPTVDRGLVQMKLLDLPKTPISEPYPTDSTEDVDGEAGE